ncbi:MAG: hypothetical protein J3Q66DRAFT_393120 [Benniella sp.]|nr:MAG: hypothetical protein J3Q66DRAFT_393120 [Benniella sp.]
MEGRCVQANAFKAHSEQYGHEDTNIGSDQGHHQSQGYATLKTDGGSHVASKRRFNFFRLFRHDHLANSIVDRSRSLPWSSAKTVGRHYNKACSHMRALFVMRSLLDVLSARLPSTCSNCCRKAAPFLNDGYCFLWKVVPSPSDPKTGLSSPRTLVSFLTLSNKGGNWKDKLGRLEAHYLGELPSQFARGMTGFRSKPFGMPRNQEMNEMDDNDDGEGDTDGQDYTDNNNGADGNVGR